MWDTYIHIYIYWSLLNLSYENLRMNETISMVMSFNEQAAYTSKYNNGVAQRTMPFREARKQANTRKRALASSDLSQKILWKLHTAWPLWDHLTFYILLFECFILFTFKCMCMSFQAENSPIQYYTLYKHIIFLKKILQYNWLTYIKRISSINYVCISQNPPFHKLQTSVVVHPGVNPKVPTSQLLPKKVMCMDTSFLKTKKNIIIKTIGIDSILFNWASKSSTLGIRKHGNLLLGGYLFLGNS